MWCIRELDAFFTVFHLFGLSSFIPSKASHIKRLLISSMIFKLVHLAVALAFASYNYQMTHNVKNLTKQSNFNLTIRKCFDSHVFMLIIFVLFKSIVSPHLLRQICEHFCLVIQDMEFHLQITLQMKRFKKAFARTFLLNLLFASMIMALFPLYYLIEIIFAIVDQIFFSCALFHIILFIDLIGLSLHSINIKLEEHLCFKQPYMRIIILFRYLKSIHYNLWRIARILNKEFGLLLLLLLLHYFIKIVLLGYHIFLNWPKKSIAGKWISYNSSTHCLPSIHICMLGMAPSVNTTFCPM